MRFARFGLRRLAACLAAALLFWPAPGNAQDAAVASAAEPAGDEKPAFKAEELEQLLAPIALYPDSLLTQVFMASTYPLEIVEAERWVRKNPDMKAEGAAAALEDQSWDPSVKSLVNFPEVLTMLSDQLDWTQQLGDAFIGQQEDVMNAVQRLRGKANAEGQLKTTEQQTVTVQAAPPPPPAEPAATETVIVQQAPAQIITIEPAEPDVIYVPTYDPEVVYGSWSYPSYPPYNYYPPGYVASNVLSFGAGVACGAAWGYAWGHCDWGDHDVDIDIDRNANFNRDIDYNRYDIDRNSFNNIGSGNKTWAHNPEHRGNVPYRNRAEAGKFGGQSAAEAARARDAYRGRADAGRRDLPSDAANFRPGQGGAGTQRPSTLPAQGGAAAQRPSTRPGQGGAGAERPATRPGQGGAGTREAVNRPGQGGAGTREAVDRPGQGGSGTRQGSALSGAGGSGRQTAAQSDRGRTSSSSPSARASRPSSSSRPSASRPSSGGSRPSGSRPSGGSRGGGGRGGGGRR